MGETARLFRLERRKAREEGREIGREIGLQEIREENRHRGRQEGIEKAIRILERAGKSDAARLLREFNGWSPKRGQRR